MPSSLESRLCALEKAAAPIADRVTIIRIVGVSPGGQESDPGPITRIGDCTRQPGETDEQLRTRALAGLSNPNGILLAW